MKFFYFLLLFQRIKVSQNLLLHFLVIHKVVDNDNGYRSPVFDPLTQLSGNKDDIAVSRAASTHISTEGAGLQAVSAQYVVDFDPQKQ